MKNRRAYDPWRRLITDTNPRGKSMCQTHLPEQITPLLQAWLMYHGKEHSHE